MKLHLCKTYQVRYDLGTFNMTDGDVNYLLQDLVPSAIFGPENDICTASWVEFKKEHLREAIQKLEADYKKTSKMLLIYNVNLHPKFFIEVLQHWLDNSDPDNSFVHLEWF